jgi:RimJ/RimL family protein N-acetyltransferase
VDWPFPSLRISAGEVLLRGVTDADLDPLLAALPADLDLDPANERFPSLPADVDRRRQVVAEIWKHRGTWSPSSWCLDLVVEVDGEVVGIQALEGDRFPLLRTVDSYSWLAARVRGRGLATSMRTGVLALAFDHLGAEVAVSSAEPGNVPSLAVSRRLGYTDNGVSRSDGPRGPIDLQHLRLTRETWRATPHAVEIEGVAACLPWFGLGSGVS